MQSALSRDRVQKNISLVRKWRVYTTREVYVVDEEEYNALMFAKTQRVALKNGELINVAHIVCTKVHKHKDIDFTPQWAKTLQVVN